MNPYQFTLRGLVMGPGTNYYINRVSGFGIQQLRSRDIPKPMSNGAFGGLDTREVRRLTFDITVQATAGLTFLNALDALLVAWAPSPTTDIRLYFQWAVGWEELYINGRPRQCSYEVSPLFEMGSTDVIAVFECPNPIFYNLAGTSKVA